MGVDLQMNYRVHPIAPTIERFLHRKDELARPFSKIADPSANKIVLRLMFNGEGN